MKKYLLTMGSLILGLVLVSLPKTVAQETDPAEIAETLPDWTTNEILVRVSGKQYVAGSKIWGLYKKNFFVIGKEAELNPSNNAITTRASKLELDRYIQDNGRSMKIWVTQPGVKTYDLPLTIDPVDLLPNIALKRVEDGMEATVTAKNLLPGFALYFGGYDAKSGRYLPRRVLKSDSGEIRLLNVRRNDENLDEIRFFIAKGAPAGQALLANTSPQRDESPAENQKDKVEKHTKHQSEWAVYIEGIDGSQSSVIKLSHDDEQQQVVEKIRDNLASPTGEGVDVPNVTGMFFPEADKALRDVGLVAAPVDSVSLKAVLFEANNPHLQNAFVIRQGIQANEKVTKGTQIQLAISIEKELPEDDGPPPDEKPGNNPGNNNLPKDQLPEDQGPPSDLIPNDLNNDLLPEDQGPPPDQPSIDINDAGGLINPDPSLGDLNGGPSNNVGPIPPDPLDPLGPPLDPNIPPDPGVIVDPTIDSTTQQIASLILRIIIQSLSSNDPPPLVQQVLTSIANELEKNANAAGPGNQLNNVAPFLQLTAGKLGVQLTANDIRSAEGDWQKFLLWNGNALKRANSKLQARSIFLWSVRWLQNNQHQPTGQLGINQGDEGKINIVALDGKNNLNLPNQIQTLLGTLNGKLVTPTPNNPNTTPTNPINNPSVEKQLPPLGPKIVKNGSGPDRVLIPDVTEGNLKEAIAVLKKYDLKPKWNGKVFLEDLLSSQSPEPGWHDAVTHVTLNTGVPVPDVTKITLKEAISRLKGWDLKAGWPEGNAFLEDKVIGQNPRPHTKENPSTLPHGQTVKLTLGVRVPDVTGIPLKKAIEQLKGWDLKAGFDPNHAFNEDQVVKQSPQAGELAEHDAIVKLDLHVRVPDLQGQSVENAIKTLKGWDLRPDLPKRHFNESIVTQQDPPAGKLVPHEDLISVSVGIRVPNIQGLTVAQAQKRLEDWDLLASVPNKFARDGDTVRLQSPFQNTIVKHGSSVSLQRVVAVVPDVRNRPLKEAYRVLHDDNAFAVRYHNSLVGGDVVTTQQPPPGTELERGENIVIDAFVRVPSVINLTARDAAANIRRSPGDFRFNFTERQTLNNDEVIQQFPQGGTFVRPRTNINVTALPRLPNVVRMSSGRARDVLRASGFNSRVTSSATQETSNRSLIGQTIITRQFPSGGSHHSRDRIVNLTAITYIQEQKVRVPNLTGKTLSQARILLQQAGLSVGRTVNSAVIDGHPTRIRSTLPSAGTEVRRGTSVHLYFPPRELRK